MAEPGAGGDQIASHFASGEHTAVQTKSMTGGLGRETVLKDASKINRENAGTVVLNGQFDSRVRSRSYSNPDQAFAWLDRLQGIFRVLQKVDQNLQNFVPVGLHLSYRFEYTFKRDAIATQGFRIQPQRVLEQLRRPE